MSAKSSMIRKRLRLNGCPARRLKDLMKKTRINTIISFKIIPTTARIERWMRKYNRRILLGKAFTQRPTAYYKAIRE
jgi:hypothetical protein